MIDPRVVRVGVTINGITTWYKDLWIEAKGAKVSSSIAAACDITIIGLDTDTRNFILRETRPNTPNKKRVTVELEVGRESYGAVTYFKGDVFRSAATPKPNLGIVLKCITGFNNKQVIVQNTSPEITKLSTIAKTVAAQNGYSLEFQVTDRNIRSYSFTGSAFAALVDLEKICNCDVFVDSGTLFIKDSSVKSKSRVVYQVNTGNGTLIESTGTESGAKVKILLHPSVNIGGQINLQSDLNPQLDGTYNIYKLDFDITSRGQPFYLIVEGNIGA